MGSGGSRLHGVGAVRPLFLYQLEEIKKRSQPLVRGCSPRPLLHEAEYQEISHKDDVKKKKKFKEKRQNDAGKKLDDDEDSDDDDGEEDRVGGILKIGRGDHGGFIGSPSFRVFVKSDGNDVKHGDKGKMKNIDALEGSISSDDTEHSEESCSKNNEIKKKGSRRRAKSLSMVLPKGQAAVKNLLNVKTCYMSPSSRPPNRHTHLTTEKETVA